MNSKLIFLTSTMMALQLSSCGGDHKESLLGKQKRELTDYLRGSEQVETMIEYQSAPTPEQRKRDIMYYHVLRYPAGETSYGFNAEGILIELRTLKIERLHNNQ